jgi:hypothetical protein
MNILKIVYKNVAGRVEMIPFAVGYQIEPTSEDSSDCFCAGSQEGNSLEPLLLLSIHQQIINLRQPLVMPSLSTINPASLPVTDRLYLVRYIASTQNFLRPRVGSTPKHHLLSSIAYMIDWY